MHIHLILKKYRHEITAYDVNKLLYTDVINDTDINTEYVLCISTTTFKFQISLTRILSERTSASSVLNWSAFETYLPEDQWVFFKTSIPTPYAMYKLAANGDTELVKHDYPTFETKSVQYYSSPEDEGMILEYGSLTNNMINVQSLSWLLQEIIVTDNNSSIRLENALPIVNGNVCIPTMFNGKMYIENSTKWLKNTPDKNHTVSFLDFSNIGNLEFIKFKDTAITKTNNILNITLPNTTTFANKSMLLVMSNRLLLEGEYNVINDKNISIDTRALGVNKFLLKNKVKSKDNIFNTPTYQDPGLDYYLTNYVGSSTDTENFFILIDNINIDYIKYDIKLRLKRQGFIYDPMLQGLLYNTDTCEIEEGVKIIGDTTTMLTTTEQPIVNRIVNNNLVGYVDANIDMSEDTASYKLIDIVSV